MTIITASMTATTLLSIHQLLFIERANLPPPVALMMSSIMSSFLLLSRALNDKPTQFDNSTCLSYDMTQGYTEL
jgi:hypothetical protein